jgi:hypothetical protein
VIDGVIVGDTVGDWVGIVEGLFINAEAWIRPEVQQAFSD